MNKALVLNLEENNGKEMTFSNKPKDLPQKKFETQLTSARLNLNNEYNALYSKKNFYSNKQNKVVITEINCPPYCLSESNILTDKSFVEEIAEINGLSEKMNLKPVIKDKKTLVVDCLEVTMGILDKMKREFSNVSTKESKTLYNYSQEYSPVYTSKYFPNMIKNKYCEKTQQRNKLPATQKKLPRTSKMNKYT